MKGNEARPNDIQLGAETNKSVTSIVMSRAFAKITNKTKRNNNERASKLDKEFQVIQIFSLSSCS